MERKHKQLGMNPSTAAHKLRMDILFSFVSDRPCYRCKEPMTRSNFSIEHKIAWLDSDNPVELYFDLSNIDFSHLSCNISAAKRVKLYASAKDRKKAQWQRYYAKNSQRVLANKRARYKGE